MITSNKKIISNLINNKYINFFINAALVLSISFSFIILSVKFALFFKPLYYLDINKLNITENSSLSRNEIKKNYSYIIDYLTQNKTDNFKLPTLPTSTTGKLHFKEVKLIFDNLNATLFFTLIISIIGITLKLKHKNLLFLKWCSLTLIFIPLILSIPFIINFDSSFTLFHKIIFKNDYWLFSVKSDPVITILPQKFFYHCAILILSLIFGFSVSLRIIYNKKVSIKTP